MHYIYRIRNKVNGKTYIGQHKYKKLNDSYMGSGVLLAKAKKKYGLENFTKEILEFNIESKELADDWEQMYILFERAKGKAEYNIANGGQGAVGVYHSEETRRKMSEALKGRVSNRKGCKLSEETKRKISEAKKCKTTWNKGKPGTFKGKTHSGETRRKMSEARKGKKQNNRIMKHWKLVDGKRVWY